MSKNNLIITTIIIILVLGIASYFYFTVPAQAPAIPPPPEIGTYQPAAQSPKTQASITQTPAVKNPTTQTPEVKTPAKEEMPVETSQVTIQGFTFGPANITVKKGTMVFWTNEDAVPHRIESDSAYFKSEAFLIGQKYAFTFEKIGVFPYHCAIHPFMKGIVIVTEK